MNIVNAAKERMEFDGVLSNDEVDALIELVRKKSSGYMLSRVRHKVSKMPLGEKTGVQYNPITGIEYKGEKIADMEELAEFAGWCGQWAGRAQWESIGRTLIDKAHQIKLGKLYGRDIIVYAYEQTK